MSLTFCLSLCSHFICMYEGNHSDFIVNVLFIKIDLNSRHRNSWGCLSSLFLFFCSQVLFMTRSFFFLFLSLLLLLLLDRIEETGSTKEGSRIGSVSYRRRLRLRPLALAFIGGTALALHPATGLPIQGTIRHISGDRFRLAPYAQSLFFYSLLLAMFCAVVGVAWELARRL